MTESDKPLFKTTINLMTDSLNLPNFTGRQLHTWFDGLLDYSIQDVTQRIDSYLEANNNLPELSDIQKHEVTIRPRVITPLTVENNKAHLEEVKQEIKTFKGKDDKGWAKAILANPKGKTELQLKFARVALNIK